MKNSGSTYFNLPLLRMNLVMIYHGRDALTWVISSRSYLAPEVRDTYACIMNDRIGRGYSMLLGRIEKICPNRA